LVGRLPEEVEEGDAAGRRVVVEGDPGLVALDGLEDGGQGRSRQATVVDQLLEGGCGGVGVRQVDEEKVLQAGRRLIVDAGEGPGEGAQERRGRSGADLLAHGRQRRGDRHRRSPAGGLDDRQVRDLVEEAEGEELAGQGLALAGRAIRVQRGDDATGARGQQGTRGGDRFAGRPSE
jgi:hypothetical protein